MMEFQEDADLLAKCLDEVNPQSKAMFDSAAAVSWIGSGVSRVAASVGDYLTTNSLGLGSRSCSPLEVAQGASVPYLPVFLSYGGKNQDILKAADVIARQHKKAILITSKAQTPVCQVLVDRGVEVSVFVLPEHSPDNRFVAVRAMWSMVGAAVVLSLGQSRNLDTFRVSQLARMASLEATNLIHAADASSWTDREWTLLHSPLAKPGAVAWDSIFGESAISSFSVGDVKDYSHGRYLALLAHSDRSALLLLGDSQTKNLDEIIQNRFGNLLPVLKCEASASLSDVECLLLHTLVPVFVADGVAKQLGRTISSPHRPAFSGNWRNWGTIRSKDD